MKAEDTTVKIAQWTEGKPGKPSKLLWFICT